MLALNKYGRVVNAKTGMYTRFIPTSLRPTIRQWYRTMWMYGEDSHQARRLKYIVNQRYLAINYPQFS